MGRTAAALVIGNELLSGKVQDANVQELARLLRALGVDLRRVVMVTDDIDVIAAEVNSLRQSHDLLFTSGGVGPTHDDVTVAGVARALGRAVVRSPTIEALLRGYYGDALRPGHLHMADIVEGTELYAGRSPQWPTMVLGNVFVLPGVPEIFRLKLAALADRLRGDEAPFESRSVYCTLEEAELRPHLDAVVAAFPDVFVGSYPRWRGGDHAVRVTFDGRTATQVEAAADRFAALLPDGVVVRRT
ncbi:MAG: molybdopterin-binding protein [Polyangiales bacterium]